MSFEFRVHNFFACDEFENGADVALHVMRQRLTT